jgi:hypothetical protein
MQILSTKFCFAKLGNNFQRSHPWQANIIVGFRHTPFCGDKTRTGFVGAH